MAKKRLSNKELKIIAASRMSILMQKAKEEVRIGNCERARRYVILAKKISNKTKTPLEEKYCKSCLLPLMPGVNCTVRLNNHLITTSCTNCGKIIRTPLASEQSD